MEGMSEREYSAHSGLSRGAIQKARRASRLVVYSDGSINAAASDVRRAGMTDPDQRRRSIGGDSAFRPNPTVGRRDRSANQASRDLGFMRQVPGGSASSRTTKSRNALVLRASRRPR